MAKSLSVDLRRRVFDAVEAGSSCGVAADRFGVGVSSGDLLGAAGNLARRALTGSHPSLSLEDDSLCRRPPSIGRERGNVPGWGDERRPYWLCVEQVLL